MLQQIGSDCFHVVVGFLDGVSRLNLRQCCKEYQAENLLMYDGPVDSLYEHVTVLGEAFQKECTRTAHGFLVQTCRPPCNGTVRTRWITELASNPDVTPSRFICGWRALTDAEKEEYTDELVHDSTESMCDVENDPQTTKVYYLLAHTHPSDFTLDYVLRFACLHQNLSLVQYLLTDLKCQVTENVLMMALVSSERTAVRDKLVSLVLGSLTSIEPVVAHDFWAVKYTVFTNDWYTFELLYRLVLQTNIQVSDRNLCSTLPEGQEYTALLRIRELRSVI